MLDEEQVKAVAGQLAAKTKSKTKPEPEYPLLAQIERVFDYFKRLQAAYEARGAEIERLRAEIARLKQIKNL